MSCTIPERSEVFVKMAGKQNKLFNIDEKTINLLKSLRFILQGQAQDYKVKEIFDLTSSNMRKLQTAKVNYDSAASLLYPDNPPSDLQTDLQIKTLEAKDRFNSLKDDVLESESKLQALSASISQMTLKETWLVKIPHNLSYKSTPWNKLDPSERMAFIAKDFPQGSKPNAQQIADAIVAMDQIIAFQKVFASSEARSG